MNKGVNSSATKYFSAEFKLTEIMSPRGKGGKEKLQYDQSLFLFNLCAMLPFIA